MWRGRPTKLELKPKKAEEEGRVKSCSGFYNKSLWRNANTNTIFLWIWIFFSRNRNIFVEDGKSCKSCLVFYPTSLNNILQRIELFHDRLRIIFAQWQLLFWRGFVWVVDRCLDFELLIHIWIINFVSLAQYALSPV